MQSLQDETIRSPILFRCSATVIVDPCKAHPYVLLDPDRLVTFGHQSEHHKPKPWSTNENADALSIHKRKRRKKMNAKPPQQQLYAERDHSLVRAFLMNAHQEAMASGSFTKGAHDGNITAQDPSLIESAVDWAEMGTSVAVEADVHELQKNFSDARVTNLDELFSTIYTNTKKVGIQLHIKESKVLINIPPRSTFLMSDILHVDSLVSCGPFDLIVTDFPWPNSSVHSKYTQLDRYDIFKIPFQRLASPNCLVVFWMTNTPRHSEFVKNKVLRDWKLDLAGEWYWCKVGDDGAWVRDLDDVHRKPYEKIILAVSTSRTVGTPIPSMHTVFSIPSRFHSRKPPLQDVLKPYLPDSPRCLELFARNLVAGWTSWGNEVLKFQAYADTFDG
ncbi:hypothetical protein SeMB42_g05514 [Synchytrium endobioticum]|uniref:Methyltransferase-like protein 4 n=1 Tax=Synchytrium endobioticum TaxID=286115 RepID=A0A507CCY5_9FUNG|nr:hypothetical protein SeLEV6574_g07260 [Synchytrium endobioticum]TPX41587.1 hypothetical protein SeMB42_g05514 [Synchytrium endobioticum]